MKFPYRLRRNPAGKKALVHTTNQVLYLAGTFITAWFALPKEEKLEFLASLGLPAENLVLYVLLGTVVLAFIAKNTSIQKVPPTVEPEQLREDPDHGES